MTATPDPCAAGNAASYREGLSPPSQGRAFLVAAALKTLSLCGFGRERNGTSNRRIMGARDRKQNITVRHVEGKGNCLFAMDEITAGEIIGYFEGPEITTNTMHSLHLEEKIIDGAGVLKNLAHSCDHNAYFKDKRRWLYARKDIAAGDEVTIDYLDTERIISHPFFCQCGSPNCRGKIE
jgi:SET domain